MNQIDGTLTTLEYQREALENADTNREVLKMMLQATDSLKTIHSGINITDIEDLKDDIAEQQELTNEIANVISSPMGQDALYDDEDLLKELEELEQENLDEDLLKIPPAASDALPKVPTGEPSIETKGKLF